ncbi:DsbA family protein [Reichenbachiella versicolor]|uniref:DsbA family protein n=1 Tax=Reichenbachiella versicolor TaxID=1821036 RepID=UPI000D6E7F92|nr:DsbA family protein [Reichenbachiella versicolor]
MGSNKVNCENGTCEVPLDNNVNNNESNTDKVERPRLYYFGDPMCSWCWGIAPSLDRLKSDYQDLLDFEIVLGGLRPGGGDEWTREFREMIRTHWEHVNEASGQPFDFTFLEREEFEYDTEPPARAVRVVRDIAPEKEWEFFKYLQKAFYALNQDILDLKVMEQACKKLDIEYAEFEPLFLSKGYKQLVNKDFMKSQKFGVRGFPSLILQTGDEYFAISMGYSPYDQIKRAVESVLSASETVK